LLIKGEPIVFDWENSSRRIAVLTVVGPVAAEEHMERGHPERPARIGAVMDGVADLHLGSDLLELPARAATIEQLGRIHSPAYLDQLRRFCSLGGGSLDPDTYAHSSSWDAACLAAGAGLVAIDAVRGHGGVAFVPARPPGHHALADRSMGFCLLNNVALAAASLADAGEKVLIVDWDVHHGNGTQAIFWEDPAVLYVSTHQWPCYPGSGRSTDVGGAAARGSNVNVPLPAGTTGDVVRRAFDQMVAPVVDRFEPTWVLVSAGFDAHRADPLAELCLSAGDFAGLAAVVSEYAPGPRRLVLFLEGGYDLDALRSSVSATLGALLGASVTSEPPTSGGPGREQLDAAQDHRRAALHDQP
jgi:acetoin utilization deacetylase AcuC-like enzyme